MATKTKKRNTYVVRPSSAANGRFSHLDDDKRAEQSWFILAMGLFLALGIGLIGAITYALLLG